MDHRIAIDLAGRGLEDLGARALRQRQHVDGPDDAGLYRVHRIALVMDRRGRAGEVVDFVDVDLQRRSEEHTSELQSLMRISYAVFCLKKKKKSKISKNKTIKEVEDKQTSEI